MPMSGGLLIYIVDTFAEHVSNFGITLCHGFSSPTWNSFARVVVVYYTFAMTLVSPIGSSAKLRVRTWGWDILIKKEILPTFPRVRIAVVLEWRRTD